MLIDTHAHLDFPDFQEDFDAVLARAREAGVTRVITIGTSVASSERAVALAEQHADVFAVVGVHPTAAVEAEGDIISPLRELARHPRVVAIGETGLDFHRLPSAERKPRGSSPMPALTGEQPTDVSDAIEDGACKAAQGQIFELQLDLAEELGLKVVIHQRDAWAETLEILRPRAGRVRGVFHCFGGTLDQAREVLAHGHLVSFTGIITFKNARCVQETAAGLPPDAFMVETDCPYLAPVPHRGGRCEPAHTRLVAEKVAELRETGVEEIARLTTATAEKFFAFDRAGRHA